METITICEGVGVSAVPDDAMLRRLAEAGVKTLVDTREASEISDQEVARKAGALGLAYVHLPISKSRVDDAQIEGFRRLAHDPGRLPLHAFSTGGRRPAGVLCFLACSRNGDSIIEIFRRARNHGCGIDQESALKKYIYAFYRQNWPDILDNFYKHLSPARG